LGTFGGVIYSAIDSFLFKGRVPWTFKHHAPKGKNPVSLFCASFGAVCSHLQCRIIPLRSIPFRQSQQASTNR
jgi:hypothetical protein